MKYILITTVYSDQQDVWGLALARKNNPWEEDGNKLSCLIGTDHVIIFKQKDESSREPVNLTDWCVVQVKETINQFKKAKFYIAAHGSSYNELSPWAKNENNVIINYFSHREDDDLFKALQKLAQHPTAENFDSTCVNILKKKTGKFAGHFQHRFNRVIIPILIDFQGLEETAFNEDYWAEIVEDYRLVGDDPYRDFRNLADEMKRKIEDIKNLLQPGDSKSLEELVTLLEKYDQKAKVLKCLVKNEGKPCQLDDKCKLDPYECVRLNYSKSGKVGRVEELFDWAKQLQEETDKIING